LARGLRRAAAVPDAGVDEPILAEIEIAAVVVPGGGGDVVDQDDFATRLIIVAEGPARDAIGGDRCVAARAAALHSVIEIDEVIGGEVRIDGDSEQAPLGVRAEAAARGEIERGRGEECGSDVDAELAQLGGGEYRPIGGEGERGRPRKRGHEVVLKAGVDRGSVRRDERKERQESADDDHDRQGDACAASHIPLLPGAVAPPVHKRLG
jgi:hypothetical protein